MVYVDNLMPCLRTAKWRWPHSCHMVATDLEELHAFAKKIGLKRSWFQNSRIPHYDLTPNKREQAVKRGAIQITRVELIKFGNRFSLGNRAMG